MTIGERIKKRRTELELTADDVALALNKNRATIYRYESNEIEKLPITVLEPLAKILCTTPQYLMGWEDIPQTDNGVVGKRIKELRAEKQLGRIQFAELLNISDDTICNLENRNSRADSKILNKLADFFDVSTDYLLGRTNVRNLSLSKREESLLNAYNSHTEMQDAVDKLLGIDKNEDSVTIGHLAAFEGGTKQVEYTEQEVKESDKARDQFHYESMSSFDDEDE